MIDHIVHFADEAAAQADPVMGAYWTGDGGWRGDIVIPDLSVYRITGTEIVTDPETGESSVIEQREAYPGWFATVALAELSQDLLPASWIIADRTLAEGGGSSFVLYVSPELAETDLNAIKVSPLFAGADYPFHRAVPNWRIT